MAAQRALQEHAALTDADQALLSRLSGREHPAMKDVWDGVRYVGSGREDLVIVWTCEAFAVVKWWEERRREKHEFDRELRRKCALFRQLEKAKRTKAPDTTIARLMAKLQKPLPHFQWSPPAESAALQAKSFLSAMNDIESSVKNLLSSRFELGS
jgi:hypothetical protein